MIDGGGAKLGEQLGRPEQRAERDQDGTDPHHRERGRRPLDPVRHQQTDPVALAHPGSDQATRQRSAGVVELGLGDRAIVADEGLDLGDRRAAGARAARGIVHASPGTEEGLEPGPVELAARQHGDRVVGEEQESSRHLVGGEVRGELAAKLVHIHDATGRHADRRRNDLTAGVVRDPDDVSGEPGEIVESPPRPRAARRSRRSS